MPLRVRPPLPLSEALAKCVAAAERLDDNGRVSPYQDNCIKSALNTIKNDLPSTGCKNKRWRHIRYQEMLRKCRCVESVMLCAVTISEKTILQMERSTAVQLPSQIEKRMGCLSNAFYALAENYKLGMLRLWNSLRLPNIVSRVRIFACKKSSMGPKANTSRQPGYSPSISTAA